jgi:hypothetical protein
MTNKNDTKSELTVSDAISYLRSRVMNGLCTPEQFDALCRALIEFENAWYRTDEFHRRYYTYKLICGEDDIRDVTEEQLKAHLLKNWPEAVVDDLVDHIQQSSPDPVRCSCFTYATAHLCP